jgi:hypothetical protein
MTTTPERAELAAALRDALTDYVAALRRYREAVDTRLIRSRQEPDRRRAAEARLMKQGVTKTDAGKHYDTDENYRAFQTELHRAVDAESHAEDDLRVARNELYTLRAMATLLATAEPEPVMAAR